MPLRGVDTDEPLSGAAVAAFGFGFAARYLSMAGGPKVVQLPELEDLWAHGVGVLLVYEDTTTDLTQGIGIAQVKARAAVSLAQQRSVPTNFSVGVCMACDQPGPNAQAVEAAMGAASPILRAAGLLAGFYGPKAVARQLRSTRTIDVAWVVDTWGADQPGEVWNFRQLPNPPDGQRVVGGVTCDVDDAPAPVGLWTPHSANQPGGSDVPNAHDVVAAYSPAAGDPDVGSAWQLQFNGGILTHSGNRFYGSYLSLPPQLGSRGFYDITKRPDSQAGYVLWGNDGSFYTFGPNTAAAAEPGTAEAVDHQGQRWEFVVPALEAA